MVTKIDKLFYDKASGKFYVNINGSYVEVKTGSGEGGGISIDGAVTPNSTHAVSGKSVYDAIQAAVQNLEVQIEEHSVDPESVIPTVTQTTSSTQSGGDNIITFTFPNGETAEIVIKNGQQGLQGNSGVASADGIESVNNLNGGTTDTAEKVYVLGANMGKVLGDAVFGAAEVNGVFVSSGFKGHAGSGATVGQTFDDDIADTNNYYAYATSFICCYLPVSAGDKVHVKCKANGYNGGLSITDTDKKVTYASGNAATLIDQDFDITEDGFVFVSNATDRLASPVLKKYPTDGIEQRLDDVEDNLASAIDDIKEAVGREATGTFVAGYYWTGDAAVGGTFNPSLTENSSYSCCKLAVNEGDSIEIYAKGNSYNHTVVITDSSNKVKYVSGKGSLVCLDPITADADGWVYVDNMETVTSPFCRVNNAGDRQRIEQVKDSLRDSIVERRAFNLQLELGLNPYPNTANYFWETNSTSSTTGCSGWVALPKGKYLKTLAKAVTVYQADNPMFGGDYAKVNENIYVSSYSSGNQLITINKDYAFLKVSGVDSSVTSLELTPIEITASAAEKPSNKLAHVSHGKDDYLLYLPLKDKFMVVDIKAYDANPSFNGQYAHYGIDLFYDSGAGNIFMPRIGGAFTRSGETECAISVNGSGHNGYIGGHMHGYEKIVAADTKVYLDGEFLGTDDMFGADIQTMFELETHTQYLGTDGETVIADIYKRWRVVDGKLHLFNRVVWSAAVHINRAQLSMFCIFRHEGGDTNNDYLTCRATRNDNTFVYETTDGWDTNDHTDNWDIISVPAKATLQEQWGEVGHLVKQEIFENNQKSNGGMFINTNGGGEYNKMYFEFGSDFDVASGDVLFCHSALSIE